MVLIQRLVHISSDKSIHFQDGDADDETAYLKVLRIRNKLVYGGYAKPSTYAYIIRQVHPFPRWRCR